MKQRLKQLNALSELQIIKVGKARYCLLSWWIEYTMKGLHQCFCMPRKYRLFNQNIKVNWRHLRWSCRNKLANLDSTVFSPQSLFVVKMRLLHGTSMKKGFSGTNWAIKPFSFLHGRNKIVDMRKLVEYDKIPI